MEASLANSLLADKAIRPFLALSYLTSGGICHYFLPSPLVSYDTILSWFPASKLFGRKGTIRKSSGDLDDGDTQANRAES